MYVVIIWLAILKTCCSQFLLFSTSKDVRVMNLTRPKKPQILVNDLRFTTGIDYCFNESIICLIDNKYEQIYCVPLNGTHNINSTSNFKASIPSGEALACDWLTKKIYWVDSETKTLEVISLKTKQRAVLIWENIDQPRGLAVDPLSGYLFWTDWGEIPKIERCSMNGNSSSRKIIIDTDVFWPNSISLDVISKKLYWIDGKLLKIEAIDYDGKSRTVILSKYLHYPFSLTRINDVFYWTDWTNNSIYSYDVSTNRSYLVYNHTRHGTPDAAVMGIKALGASFQPSKSTPCDYNNGGCSDLCLLSSEPPGYSCICPTGITNYNETTCYPHTNHLLLLVQRTDISNISLDTQDFTAFKIPLTGIKQAMCIDYDPVEKFMYWTDNEAPFIQRAKLDGSQQGSVASDEVLNVDGIAIDWISRNIYWSNADCNRIEVQRLNTTYHRAIIIDDIYKPRAVAVLPQRGWFYWSDWGEFPKIERTDLDGGNRIKIVETGLKWPNGISIDFKESKLYFGDARTDRIEVVNMVDGKDRRVIVSQDVPHIYGITTLGNYLYWTDWQSRTLERVNRHTGQERLTILDELHFVMGIKAIDTREKLGTNGCTEKNGDCEQICFHKPSQKVKIVCACRVDYELDLDQKHCFIPNGFLVGYAAEHLYRISITNNFVSDVIPVSGVSQICAIDVDIPDLRVYWADNKAETLSRAYLNGSRVEKIVEYGISSPESLAVDWLSSNLYWADTVRKRIEVAKLNGNYRKTLFWIGLKEPRNLVVDPRMGYMYWSDWDGEVGGIFRASMDASSKLLIISDTGRINGLTIDYNTRTLYYSHYKNDVASIEMFDLKQNTKKTFNNNKSFKPMSLTQYQDTLFWVNNKNGSIIRAHKVYGTNASVIYSQQNPEIVDLKIVHSSKQDSENYNACTIKNGGCEHLCLVKPAASEYETGRTCACQTHYTMINGSCRPPENFLIFSLKNSLHCVIPTADECPDYPLPFTGIKSMRAIEYDPVTKFIYWIDGKTQNIRKSVENDPHSVVLVYSNHSGKSHHFYDIALDPYNEVLFWSCSTTDSINVTRLSNFSLGHVFMGVHGEKPRNLALHPEKGYLFWTDNGKSPRIVRMHLDGQNRTDIDTGNKIVEAITVDRKSDLLFYTYSQEIYSSNLSGGNKIKLVETYVRKIGHLAVIDSYLYYSVDYKEIEIAPCIERIDKFSGEGRSTIVKNIQVTDLISIISLKDKDFQAHPCSSFHRHGNCSHICIESSTNPSKGNCSCTMGYKLDPDDLTCSSPPPCDVGFFRCDPQSYECIPGIWRCDGTADCPSGADEENCSKCANQFRCSDGSCVKMNGFCDGKNDCRDGSDEEDCCAKDFSNFHPPYFQCEDLKCIPKIALCDGTYDCEDGSDENLCTHRGHMRNETYVGEGSSSSTILLPFVLIFIGMLGAVFAYYIVTNCKRKLERSNMTELDHAAMTPLAPQPIGAFTNAVKSGSISHSVMNGGGSTGSYERSHRTCASSSISMNNYPLNPPPSPATTILRAECCCHEYSPPMPTPCSTDVCDESDTNYRTDSDVYSYNRYESSRSMPRYGNERYSRSRRNHRSRNYRRYDEAGHSLFNADYELRPPPPTPRSISSDPPSPSSSTYRSNVPHPPPPSPTN